MNYLQILCFIVFAFSVLSSGLGIYSLLDREKRPYLNKVLFVGESFLLGSVLIVGELLLLSLSRLYVIHILWTAVLLNNLFLLLPDVQRRLNELVRAIPRLHIITAMFILLLGFFCFRNCYFMVDIDSHSAYLFTQKLWLAHGTSLYADAGNDMRIFLPQFDYIPAALGIGLFQNETIFPQLVNFLWRAVSLILVFGYVQYRFNRLYALSAAMLMLFDIHFFYSGANTSVTISGVMIALLFFCTYNFWEARVQKSSFRLMLAFLLLPQLLLSKYQGVYAIFFLLLLGFMIQDSPITSVRSIFSVRAWVCALVASLIIASLWYVKDFLVTGTPFFPMFAGKIGALGWTHQQENMFIKVFRGINASLFIKYMSYLFIWPGLIPAKIVGITISFFPLVICIMGLKSELKSFLLVELSFWLGVSLLMLMGICLASHQDPRYYRFPLGIFVYTSVVSITFLAQGLSPLKKTWIIACFIMLPALAGARDIFKPSAGFDVPTPQDNVSVLLNRTHMNDVLPRYFPGIKELARDAQINKDKVAVSAWGGCSEFNFPIFLLPIRPKITIWSTSVVRWSSYSSAELIERDLREFGIQWIMLNNEGKESPLEFISLEDYARRIVNPVALQTKSIFCHYDLPPELVYFKQR